jgi:NhaA family Na+:H+ antiporter
VPALTPPFDQARDHWRGGAGAPATVLVFGDYQCPYTRRAERVLARLREDYGDSLRVVYRNLPLTDIHPRALPAAVAAEAAALEGRFWEMHDTLFAHQKALGDDDLRRYADELGIDLAGADTAAISERLEDDYRSALASGARGTPTIFVNGDLHEDSYEVHGLAPVLEAAGAQRQES